MHLIIFYLPPFGLPTLSTLNLMKPMRASRTCTDAMVFPGSTVGHHTQARYLRAPARYLQGWLPFLLPPSCPALLVALLIFRHLCEVSIPFATTSLLRQCSPFRSLRFVPSSRRSLHALLLVRTRSSAHPSSRVPTTLSRSARTSSRPSSRSASSRVLLTARRTRS